MKKSQLSVWGVGLAIAFCVMERECWADQVVSNSHPDPTTTVWRIDQPIVTQAETEYPEILFSPGDEVLVEASGGVQTGGSGKTWKHYVNPKGNSSDSLYAGTIYIPTATPAGLVRINSVVGQTLKIKDFPEGTDPKARRLRLGYQDEGGAYADNGYYDHDDGVDDQTKDVGPASVVITIRHTKPPVPVELPPVAASPRAPMDLWWDEVDHNLWPLNPKWGRQVWEEGVLPDAKVECNRFKNEGDHLDLGIPPGTTQSPTVDEASGLQSLICQFDHLPGTVHGHINWGVVTYTGTFYFRDWQVQSLTQTGDDDYDMALVRNDQAGVTAGNEFRYQGQGKVALDLEFNASETIENFTSPWWVAFRNGVKAHPANTGDWTKAQALVDGREAIVIGLMGIDNQHYAHSEIHPVHALAIKANEGPGVQRWSYFVRNWGNEGFCSQNQHYLSGNRVAILFPRPAFSTTFELDVGKSIFLGNQAGMKWGQKATKDGIVVTFDLPAPQSKPLIHGEIEFKIDVVPQPVANELAQIGIGPPHLATIMKGADGSDHAEHEEAEEEHERPENLDAIIGRLPPAKMREWRNAMAAFKSTGPEVLKCEHVAARDDSIVTTATTAVKPEQQRVVDDNIRGVTVRDEQAAAKRRAQVDAIATVLGSPENAKSFVLAAAAAAKLELASHEEKGSDLSGELGEILDELLLTMRASMLDEASANKLRPRRVELVNHAAKSIERGYEFVSLLLSELKVPTGIGSDEVQFRASYRVQVAAILKHAASVKDGWNPANLGVMKSLSADADIRKAILQSGTQENDQRDPSWVAFQEFLRAKGIDISAKP